MSYENILRENKDGVCYITINRPKQLNALNSATIVELNKAVTEADNDNSVRCIILTGADTKAFVAGADIKEFAAFDKKDGENLARKGQELLFDLLEFFGKSLKVRREYFYNFKQKKNFLVKKCLSNLVRLSKK